MGNVLQCQNQDDQLKAAEQALENVKEQAQAYKQRIAELEAQMYKVRVAQLEKALKKERDGKSPKTSNDSEAGGEGNFGGIMSEIEASKPKEAVTRSNGNTLPHLDQQRPDFDKQPSFGRLYGVDGTEEVTNLVHGYNPVYEIKQKRCPTPTNPDTLTLTPDATLLSASGTSPASNGKVTINYLKTTETPNEDENWMRLVVTDTQLSDGGNQSRMATAASRPTTLQAQDSIAGLMMPSITVVEHNTGASFGHAGI